MSFIELCDAHTHTRVIHTYMHSHTHKHTHIHTHMHRFLFDRSMLLLDLREWDACLDDMGQAIELLPEVASLYYSRGMVYYGVGNNEEAQQVRVCV